VWLFALGLLAPWLFALQQRELKYRSQQPLAVLIEAMPGSWPALDWPSLSERVCEAH